MSKAIINDLDTQKRASFAIVDTRGALLDLLNTLGYDALTMTPQDKEVIAGKLSRVVRHNPPWTWRYIHNVIEQKIEPSKRMNTAVLRVLAVLDGAHPLMVAARPVQVYAERVQPGAVVLAASKPCANPACPVEFVPVVPRQRFCCAECRKSTKKVIK